MLESQTARIAAVADELTSLSPTGIFRDWRVLQRLAVLGTMEQALLDPENALGNFERGSFSSTHKRTGVAALRERLTQMQRPDLMEMLDISVIAAPSS